MNKETIKQVIKESQEFKFGNLVPREIEIPLSSQKIIAITGPRRSGKTCMLFLTMGKLMARGVSRERILYMNFDDPRLLPANARDIETILEAYRELYPEHRDKTNPLFFDEIQNVKGWEVGVRRIYDTKKFNIFLTGSSSKLLGKEIATDLRGRAVNFEVLPFSFREILSARELKLDRNIIYSQERFSMAKHLDTYLRMGGFPEIVLEKNDEMKVRILREYWETMFFRDLVERYHVRNQALMRELMKYLTTNTASLFSLNAFYNWIRQTYPATKRTLINYVAALEDIGLFSLIRKFSYSLKEQVTTPRKCYIVDHGLRSVYGFKFSDDKGRVLENAVFLDLRHRQTENPLMEVFYWQDYNKREVDFVIKKGRSITTLIQVCPNVNGPGTRKRELFSLLKAARELKCKKLEIITLDYEEEEKAEGNRIASIPLWKWLIRK